VPPDETESLIERSETFFLLLWLEEMPGYLQLRWARVALAVALLRQGLLFLVADLAVPMNGIIEIF
jgi:hypothetical protein